MITFKRLDNDRTELTIDTGFGEEWVGHRFIINNKQKNMILTMRLALMDAPFSAHIDIPKYMLEFTKELLENEKAST
jgi:hypothetical protein